MLAVILAGGKGTRMMPLTKDKPKAMVLLHGKPLLEHLICELKKAGIKRLLIVVGYKKEKIKEYFGNSYKGLPIAYAEQKKMLGTAHALLTAKSAAKDEKNFLVCYADVIPKSSDIKKVINAKGSAVMALRFEKNAQHFGIVKVFAGKVVSLVEKPNDFKGGALINVGLYRFTPEIFKILPKIRKSSRNEYELTDALKSLIDAGELNYVLMKKTVLDIGTLDDLKFYEKNH